jgi:hypothetical protein
MPLCRLHRHKSQRQSSVNAQWPPPQGSRRTRRRARIEPVCESMSTRTMVSSLCWETWRKCCTIPVRMSARQPTIPTEGFRDFLHSLPLDCSNVMINGYLLHVTYCNAHVWNELATSTICLSSYSPNFQSSSILARRQDKSMLDFWSGPKNCLLSFHVVCTN